MIERGEADDLVRKYGPYLARVAGRSLGGKAPDGVEVEDVVNEVFLRLLESEGALLKAYRGKSSLRAYLAGITHRIAVNAHRRESGRPILPLRAREAAEPEPFLERLPLLLERLPERDREAIRLRYFEGKPYREVASRMGVPLGTAASWVARARARIRELWEESEESRIGSPPSPTPRQA